MSTHLVVKWPHVLSSVVLVGTGLGQVYYFFFINGSGDVASQDAVARLVVRTDWGLTLPTVVLQPVAVIFLMVNKPAL